MSASKLDLRIEAFAGLAKWMEEGRRLRVLFLKAGDPVPAPLLALDAESGNGNGGTENEPRIIIPPVTPPPRPEGAREDWIWVPISAALPTTVALAILRSRGGSMPYRELLDALASAGLQFNEGSIQNAGTRLEREAVLVRGDDGWLLKKPNIAPILHDDHLWGPQNIFGPQELAAYRRICLLHILRAHSDGLQRVQLMKAAASCDWLRVPASKDVVGQDLEYMAREGMARQIGNSGKWRAVV